MGEPAFILHIQKKKSKIGEYFSQEAYAEKNIYLCRICISKSMVN